MQKENKIEEIARRRGFFWQSSEIYGGLSGFYDYAHLGTLMKRKHIKSFVDPVVKCKKCNNMERADHLIESELKESFEGMSLEELGSIIKKHNIRCSKCEGPLQEVGILNMMFPLTIGDSTKAYLRPETAQSVYVNFRREFETMRKKIPMGLAIIGKAYRNEISPRNTLIRMRSFTQAELQIFFNPSKIDDHEKFSEVKNYKLRLFPVDERQHNKIVELTCEETVEKLQIPKFYVYYMAKVQQFYIDKLGIPPKVFRFRQLSDEEKAFYNKYHWDIELYLDDLGFKEMGGIHYRTDHDLSGHEKVSKQDMSIFADEKKFIPHVLELSFGVDRNVYALLELFYEEEKERNLFSFPRIAAPYDCAVFPLVNKDGLPEKSKEIKEMLQRSNFTVFYDISGSVGRRYRRMDEIGVPACITLDNDTLANNTVTIRDRDTMKQVRVQIKDLDNALRKFIEGGAIEKLGNVVD
ncbi:glycine--tRNA ligase [archaeon]|nr:glycine--tRNA ligase [archaeon]